MSNIQEKGCTLLLFYPKIYNEKGVLRSEFEVTACASISSCQYSLIDRIYNGSRLEQTCL